MAGADYKSCSKCGVGKAIYSADWDWRIQESAPSEGVVHGQVLAVLCMSCSQTHELRAVKRRLSSKDKRKKGH
jgi:hypothetical protein